MQRRTVRRHRDGVIRLPGKEQMGTSPVSTGEYQDELVVYIHEMEKAMYDLTMTNVKRLAYDLAERDSLNHCFDRNTKIVGLSGFMKHHPDLTIRLQTSTILARMNGFNQKAVNFFYLHGSLGYRRVCTTENWELR